VPGGTLFLKVDTTHGVKEPLFDHQRLAIEMSLRTGYEYTPLTLPFADPAMRFVVKYDGSNAYIQEGAMAIEFVLDATQWRCDLQIKWDWNRVPPTDYECLPRRPAAPNPPLLPSPTAPARSPDGRREAFVQDHNVCLRNVGAEAASGGCIRVTRDGTATDAYQPGSIRWSPDGSTLSAWRVNARVWESPGVTGNVKALLKQSSVRWSTIGLPAASREHLR
jgi:hypothetical protein